MAKKNFVSPVGDDWENLRKELLTPKERAATDLLLSKTPPEQLCINNTDFQKIRTHAIIKPQTKNERS